MCFRNRKLNGGRGDSASARYLAAAISFDEVKKQNKMGKLLWPPCGIGQTIKFLPCDFYLSFFFSSPNLSGRRLDVYLTSAHGVALVRI